MHRDYLIKVIRDFPAKYLLNFFVKLSIFFHSTKKMFSCCFSLVLLVSIIRAEIQNAKASGKPFRDQRYVDVYREKQIRLVVKVIVPVKDHPKFNFVGKLLGPKGNSMRRLQEETLCKMAILGRGSMKDKKKVN